MLTAERLQVALEHQKQGRLDRAEALYREVLETEPENADALHLLGVLASQAGRHQLAASYIARAVALKPEAPFFHNNLGNVMQDLGRFGDSLLCYQQALRLEPAYADALVNMGNALTKLRRFPDAFRCYVEGQRLKPDNPEVYNNLGDCLRDQGMYRDALACFEEALRLNREHAEVHCARAVTWLLQGDYKRGWPEYEWRWKARGFTRPAHAQPLWDGSPLKGRSILLYTEQGLGDAIQFLRYAPLVKARGAGSVIVECQPALVPLAASAAGVDRAVPAGSPLPAFDVHAALLSLPHLFGTTVATIPASVPYLRVDPAHAAAWAARLEGGTGRKIGLAWAGNPEHKKDYNRSFPLSGLAPLASAGGVRFYNLQKGSPAAELLAAPFEVHALERDEYTILDTAAAILNLDLVISADTMVAHLAGALGRPAWVVLGYAADWRWLTGREDSPWYPTLRLFRQPEPGDWPSAIHKLAGSLAEWRT